MDTEANLLVGEVFLLALFDALWHVIGRGKNLKHQPQVLLAP